MARDALATWTLDQEAHALLTRLARVQPFALLMPMVTAAAISPAAQQAIEQSLARGRRVLRTLIREFLRWLHSADGQAASPSEAQRRFTLLRLRFNAILIQFDIFADVLSQRSEHSTGVWLSGLDAVAADALALPEYYESPAVMCYLDRGHGAAIRRARTRLPGGDENPVAIVRVPRERMVGSGIASSLVHEVGHQGAALLDLVNSLRLTLHEQHCGNESERLVWMLWERWISEIIADLWSVARVGIASTQGLIGVVSLPRAFVFRINLDDPHPFPWIRVKLSCAIGQALYPHAQWMNLARLWEEFYPLGDLDEERRHIVTTLDAHLPQFVSLLIQHRPSSLQGASLQEVLTSAERQPHRLMAHYQSWRTSPRTLRTTPPALAFAVIGQARAEGLMSPEEESRTLTNFLSYWALQSAVNVPPPREVHTTTGNIAQVL
jgi:hypothetical protein